MSKTNVIGVYLGKEDQDLRLATEGLDNKQKAEIAKHGMRIYFSTVKRPKMQNKKCRECGRDIIGSGELCGKCNLIHQI